MDEDEAKQIRSHLIEIARSRAEANPDLANEVIRRLTERGENDAEVDVVEQVEDALVLLATYAFLPTKSDLVTTLTGLSGICGVEAFDDALFLDPDTERVVSLMQSLGELDSEEAELREQVRIRRRPFQNEFGSWVEGQNRGLGRNLF